MQKTCRIWPIESIQLGWLAGSYLYPILEGKGGQPSANCPPLTRPDGFLAPSPPPVTLHEVGLSLSLFTRALCVQRWAHSATATTIALYVVAGGVVVWWCGGVSRGHGIMHFWCLAAPLIRGGWARLLLMDPHWLAGAERRFLCTSTHVGAQPMTCGGPSRKPRALIPVTMRRPVLPHGRSLVTEHCRSQRRHPCHINGGGG